LQTVTRPTNAISEQLPKLSERLMPTTENTTFNTLPKTTLHTIIEDTNTVNLSNVSQIRETKTSITTLELLNPIKNAPLSIIRDSSLKTGLKPLKNNIVTLKKLGNKLIFGITAGSHTKKMQNLDGYHAGLMVVKPLSEKWFLSTGLNFRQTNIEQQNPITSYVELRLDQAALIGTTNALQKAQPISVVKLRYLDLPFTIDYKITKKWSVSTGVKLSYLVGQKTITNDTSVFLVKNAYNSRNVAVLNEVSSSSLGLNRWDGAVVGGIQYLPTRHIQLGLRYDFGLFNNVNRIGKFAYNRYLGLNAVYLF
jgi:hypothetical protein